MRDEKERRASLPSGVRLEVSVAATGPASARPKLQSLFWGLGVGLEYFQSGYRYGTGWYRA